MATSTGGNPFLDRAYALTGTEEARELYDEWAATFDADITGETQGYVAPGNAADTVVRVAGTGATILDAGCGTGLAGVELARRGATTIDGVDLSPGMLERARATGAYRDLGTADLTRPLAAADGAYDVVVCVGTLTHGHVGSSVLAEFVRVVRSGGYVVATVLDDIWETDGFRAEVDRLAAGELVEMVSAELEPYRSGQSVDCRMLVLRVR
ncbi:class I SAM-dependent methyltransferase [Pseudonocardia sp. KRD291]|uniref:class I SAM-dependent DNA methyltransferase n=1 Tax=Pseudonocardia sp. KRD291 TaxID=2792007 RepID=UPI001C4A44C2|nr:class I SAM-dependent methyltransferase [Pseudonocardia sp. KRD291]MBW0105120.1 class I SAM-dependent methyltransferase [Pseudonocardia sp. KRD291]